MGADIAISTTDLNAADDERATSKRSRVLDRVLLIPSPIAVL